MTSEKENAARRAFQARKNAPTFTNAGIPVHSTYAPPEVPMWPEGSARDKETPQGKRTRFYDGYSR